MTTNTLSLSLQHPRRGLPVGGTRIVHISDIHFRGQTRHQEYVNGITCLLDYQREVVQADLCVVTGDIWHTKTQGIAPESIEILSWFFRELSKAFLGVRVILGNHDGNLTNLQRQDLITPILHALNLPNVILWKVSGVYPEPVNPSIRWCVYSPFDKDRWHLVEPEPDQVNVALFHGVVQGCVTDSEWRMQHSEAEMRHFRGKYPFALLGDIHKRQVLETREDKDGVDKGWIAYAGSLIQQTHGEKDDKGGLIWTIRGSDDWDLEEFQIPSFQPFVTTPWQGTVDKTIDHLVETQPDRVLKPGSRVRVLFREQPGHLDPRDLRTTLTREPYLCDSVTWKVEPLPRVESPSSEGGDTSDANNTVVGGPGSPVGTSKAGSLRRDPDYLGKMFESYLKASGGQDPVPGAVEALQGYLAKVVVDDRAREDGDPGEGGEHVGGAVVSADTWWNLDTLEFENTFKYRSKNSVDFQNLSGVVGLFGPNWGGKSSVVGSLLYGLFGTTDRGPVKSGAVINLQEKRCSASVGFRVGADHYLVERQTYRKEPKTVKKGKTGGGSGGDDASNSVVNLWKIDPVTKDKVSKNGDTGPETDKVIRGLVGTADDFLLTAVSSQGDVSRFIQRGATQRKAILSRFLDLDLFERLHTLAKDDLNQVKVKVGDWSPDRAKKDAEDYRNQIEVLEEERRTLEETRRGCLGHLSGISQEVLGASQQLQAAEGLLTRLEARYAGEERKLSTLQNQETDLIETLAEMPTEQFLTEKSVKYQSLRDQVSALGTKVQVEQGTLKTQERAARTLHQVPCGTQFPECKFIRDSHHAAALIGAQTALVEDLVKNRTELLQALADLGGDTTKDLRVLQDTQAKLAKTSSDVLDLLDRSSRTRLEVEQARQQVESLKGGQVASPDVLREKAALEAKVSFLDKEILDRAEKVGAKKGHLRRTEQDTAAKTGMVAELASLEQLVGALGKTGLPAAVLASHMPGLNDELDRILLGVVDFRVILDVDGGTGSNVMDIFLEDHVGRRPIEVCSGAEQMISALAIRVALYNLSTLPKPDVFVIDEGFGVLDDQNLPKVTGFLQSLKNWFKTILVVSHVAQVKEAVDSSLEISYDNGYPTLRG